MEQQVASKKKWTKPSRDQSPITQGKIPAQAVDLEDAILGVMLLEARVIDDVVRYLPSSDVFYSGKNRDIYEAILALKSVDRHVDMLTVSDKLKENGKLDRVGGNLELVRLTNSVISSAHVVSHCLVVKEKYLKRVMASIASEMMGMAYSESDVFKDIDHIESQMLSINASMSLKDPVGLNIALPEAILDLVRLRELKEEFTGIPTGSCELDELIGGWQPGDLVVLGARPSTGKTAKALSYLIAAGKAKIPSALFSMEMNTIQIAKRILSITTGFDNDYVKSPKKVSENKFTDMVNLANTYLNLPIYIDDSSEISLMQLKSKIRRLVSKKGCKLVVIDYLQLMPLPVGTFNKNDGYGVISRTLKILAKELQITIVLLSQLSRESDKMNRRPQPHDLRDSGAIEADADVIIMLYHPIDSDIKEAEELGERLKKAIMANVCKNRNGRKECIPFWPNWNTFTFTDTYIDYNNYDNTPTAMGFTETPPFM